MNKETFITTEQEKTIDMLTKQIQSLPGGKYIKVFRSLTGTVRLQDDRTEETRKHTRMFCVCSNDTPGLIWEKMMRAYEGIAKELSK